MLWMRRFCTMLFCCSVTRKKTTPSFFAKPKSIFLFTSIITNKNTGIRGRKNSHKSYHILFSHDSHAKNRMSRTTVDFCFSGLSFFFFVEILFKEKQKKQQPRKAIWPRFVQDLLSCFKPTPPWLNGSCTGISTQKIL